MTMKKVFVRSGEALFEEGDEANAAYLIEVGAIDISTGKGDARRLLAVLRRGDIVGEMAIIDGLPRSATATAVGDAVLAEVSKETILERMKQGDDIVVHLLSVLISRLRAANSSAPLELRPPRISGKILDELMADQAIRDASRRSEFIPYFQPIVRRQDQVVVGYEALARWQGTDGAVHVPDAFMPVAERTSAIKGIDICIMEGACQAIGRINQLRALVGLDAVHVSVNLSAGHFLNSEIVSVAEKTMARCGIPRGILCIEVTETVRVANQTEAAEALSRFRDLGVG